MALLLEFLMSSCLTLDRVEVPSAATRASWPVVCGGLICLGLTLSGYLLWRSLLLQSGGTVGADICSAVFGSGCDSALSSTGSWWLSVPVAGWGLAYFALLETLLILGWLFREDFGVESRDAVSLLALGGMSVSLLLAARMLRSSSPHCPLCWAIHTVNLAVLVTVWRSTEHSASSLLSRLISALRYASGGEAIDPVAARRRTLYLVVAFLVAGITYQWSYVQAAVRTAKSGQPDPQALIAGFEQASHRSIQLSQDDPRLGPASAKAQLVIFSDFQCPACKRLAGDLRGLEKKFTGDVSIVFKHYPLNSACNPSIRNNMHPLAYAAARASIAAARQGKFWEFHDGLFEIDYRTLAGRPEGFEAALTALAGRLGLDEASFNQVRQSDLTAANVHADVDEGNRLGVEGTPTIYLNGRQVDRIDPQAIETLIRHVIDSSR